MMKLFVFALALVAVSAEELRAIAVLENKGIHFGNITFRQIDNGPVTVTGTVIQLTPGKHGFHIHERGDLSGGCISTGGHFNPNKHNHGDKADDIRHVGDLGNIVAGSNSVASIDLVDDEITLCCGPHSVIGRAVVVHSGEDDLGKGGAVDSLTTGHAGARVACGIIGVLSPTGAWPASHDSENAAPSTAATLLMTTLTAIAATFLTI